MHTLNNFSKNENNNLLNKKIGYMNLNNLSFNPFYLIYLFYLLTFLFILTHARVR